MLAYRTTPLECGFSPSELMFGRKVRSFMPLLPSQLNNPVDKQFLINRESKVKEKSVKQFNNRHRSRKLSDLEVGDYVWVTDLRVYAKILEILDEPRSYLIESNSGIYRRNRWHLIPAPYYTQQQFTPAYTSPDNYQSLNSNNNSSNLTETYKECKRNDISSTPEGESLDVSGSSFTSPNKIVFPKMNVYLNDPVSPKLSIENSNVRPRCEIKKPRYLDDYVCKLN